MVYADRDWGTRELARELGLSKSAVHRLLRDLSARSILVQNSETQRYALGPGFYALAAGALGRFPFVRAARPIMRELVDRFDETVYVCMYDQGDLVFLDKVECSHAIRYVIQLGRQGNPHAGAAAKAILAFQPTEEIERIIGERGLPTVTANTVTDRERLERDLATVRREGYSLTFGERIPGAVGLAGPILDARDVAAGALVLTMPDNRFDPTRAAEYGVAVRDAAARLSRSLGFQKGARPLAEAHHH